MANNWDARIKLLYPADQGTSFTADTVKLNDPFDAVGDIEVGRGTHQFTVEHTLRVSVRNLSRSTTIATGTKNEKPMVAGLIAARMSRTAESAAQAAAALTAEAQANAIPGVGAVLLPPT